MSNTYPAVSRLLRIILYGSLRFQGIISEKIDYLNTQSRCFPHQSTEKLFHFLTIKRISSLQSLSYSWPLAHQLAGQYQMAPQDMAQQLALLVLSYTERGSAKSTDLLLKSAYFLLQAEIQQGLRATPTDKGLVQLDLSDRALGAWLRYLRQTSLLSIAHFTPELGDRPTLTHLPIFPVQYAHARCCSWLRLAHDSGWIQLKQGSGNPYHWEWQDSQSAPWPNDREHRWFKQPPAQDLIHHLIDVFDVLDGASKPTAGSPNAHQRQVKSLMRVGITLSQAVDRFQRAFQPWSRQLSLEQLQIYFGLLLIAQRALCLLLEDHLKSNAPVEL